LKNKYELWGEEWRLKITFPSAHKSLWAVQRAKALFTPWLKPRRKMGNTFENKNSLS